MVTIQSGVLDRARLVSNILMLILLIGNIFFSIQYMTNVQYTADEKAKTEERMVMRAKVSSFLKFFIDTVINTQSTISYEDRVKLESDLRQIHEPALTAQWDIFVASKDGKDAQTSAAKLMSLLAAKLM